MRDDDTILVNSILFLGINIFSCALFHQTESR